MRIRKTLLLFVTLIVMGLLFSMPVSADTYTWQCGASVKASYNTSTGYLYITGTGAMYDDWSTPNYAGMKSISIGSGVTSIGPRAFSSLSITNVTLPTTLTSIGNSAFSSCSNLKSINIPNSVTSLGTSVFSGCSSLTNVTLGSGITKIPDSAFSSCYALTAITIPSSVKEIGTSAFSLTGLTSIDIPDSVTVIGNSAFSACRSLETINMSNKVKSIGDTVFHDTLISTIELPNTLTTIGKSVFNSCDNLSDITLPDSLTSIPESAFNGCVALTEITLPKNITSVGNNAFKGCVALHTVNYNAVNCSYMGSKSSPAFSGCSALKNINIASNVKIIPSYAFYGCSAIENLVFPNSITSMGANVVGGCSNLKELSIPFVGSKRGNTGTDDSCLGYIFDYTVNHYMSGSTGYVSQPYLGYGVNSYVNFFMPSPLTKIVITDETVIGVGALSKLHSVTEVVLPDTLLRIEKDAFTDGAVLAKVNLPINLTYLGEDAFTRCYALSNVICDAKNCDDSYDAFTWSGKNTELTIGESVETLPYFNGLNTTIINFNAINCNSTYSKFSDKTEIINIGDKVTKLPPYIFSGCKLVTSVNIPNSVTYIGAQAFARCDGLTEMTIPNSVKNIGELIFVFCPNLKTINIGSGLETMDFLMFSNTDTSIEKYVVSSANNYFSSVDGNLYNKDKTKLIHYALGKSDEIFVVPSTVTTLGDYSLRSSKLKRISLPETLLDLGKSTFYGCSNLESINIPNSIREFKEYLFYGCEVLDNITISSNVVSIEKYAFYNTGISSITLSKNVIGIGNCAFTACKKLKNIVVDDENLYYSAANGALYNKEKDYLISYAAGNESECYIMPNTVKSIAESSFNCSKNLASIVFSEQLEVIARHSFYGCTNLKQITIPRDLTTVEWQAFDNCTSISDIYFYGDEEYWSELDIKGYNTYFENATVHFNRTVTYIGDYNDVSNVFSGEDVQLPVCEEDGYKYTFEVDGTAWDGKNVTSDVTVSVEKVLVVFQVIYQGDYEDVESVTYGADAELPYVEGYNLSFTVDGVAWTGKNITADVVVDVSKTPIEYTITYIGGYTGTDKAGYKSDVTLPVPELGYKYTFYVDDTEWAGKCIESDTTVLVVKIAIPITTTTYELLSTGLYKFKIEPTVNLNGEEIILAVYSNSGRLIDFKTITSCGDTEYIERITASSDMDYAKIFVWQSLSGLKPVSICEYLEIP